MELSESGSLVMSTCNGTSRQQWAWKRSDSAASFVRKKKSHSKPMISASAVKQPPKIAQEIAVEDY